MERKPMLNSDREAEYFFHSGNRVERVHKGRRRFLAKGASLTGEGMAAVILEDVLGAPRARPCRIKFAFWLTCRILAYNKRQRLARSCMLKNRQAYRPLRLTALEVAGAVYAGMVPTGQLEFI